MAATERKLQTALDKSSKSLAAAAASLAKQIDAVTALPELAESLSQSVMAEEIKLEQLKTAVEDGAREAAAELAIRVKEDETALLLEMMRYRGWVQVSEEEYGEMINKLESLSEEMDQRIKSEVGKAVGMAQAKADNEAKLTEAANKLETAQIIAENAQLVTMNQFMQRQVEEMQGTLVAERQARVEVEKARAEQKIEVNTGGDNSGSGRR